jgi:hypothetical protein
MGNAAQRPNEGGTYNGRSCRCRGPLPWSRTLRAETSLSGRERQLSRALGVRYDYIHLARADGTSMTERAPTSVLLDDLFGQEVPEQVTLGWLMGRLGSRSFGIIVLVLALIGLLPGLSALAGVLLMVPAAQMILARPVPEFPRWIAVRPFEARRLARVVRRVVPVLRAVERFIRPRWPTPFQMTKRVVGSVILLLAASLLAPVPLSNIPPALVIGLIAFAYLEEDGVLLSAALALALVMLSIASVAAWEALSATGWVPGLL